VTKKKFKNQKVLEEISTFWKFSTFITSQKILFRDLQNYNFNIIFDEIPVPVTFREKNIE
jgi:hypothetical protein